MTLSPVFDNLKKDLDRLKNQLNHYNQCDVRRARDRLDRRRRRVRDRCYFKIKEIDFKFNLCRNVNVFLDLCGGPGQFAKYVFDVNDDCKGYGVTLRNHCDYNFCHSNFRKMYGCFDTGDIFDTNVLFELMYFCRGKCDLVLADGAFDVAGRDNDDQETLSLSLIRKECSVILETLRVGGSCVVKIFDTFNNSTISLLQNFVNHFEQYHLYKPTHSCAANSEKYLVCKGKLAPRASTLAATTTTTPEIVFNAQTRKFARQQKRALKRLLAILENDARLDENHDERPTSARVL
ncbi:asb092 [Agrotis segetum nucleopolyhedrovirus B]|uniref:Asb092 n=1 Tax=Agrotis segetum nucleopolyhedrovirus B TaxID=1580580 RepID=A0A0A7KR76_9ABAC|nr:asb092 [Agrotis segetum nucleopolyhedrovirus B]AIZ48649.1 asb092 [Agrotis segetum nucleopolyhedrovirus B]